ncbi:MAG: DUF2785 domain-containing protein [Clostridia bacterium]|nr:DUF2785 domain-containing protein [Clostridia bacterium]
MIDLKMQLASIAANNYELPSDINVCEVLEAMLENIGSLDAELRDHLIYATLSRWIERNQLEKELLSEIMTVVTDDEHLFYKIDIKDVTSVFTRSFSVLIVAALVYYHRQHGLFNVEEIKAIYEKVCRYFREEMDLRGYVDVQGWAHSAAHTADAIDELAMCDELNQEHLINLLELIKEKIATPSYVYVHEEDERMVTAVVNVIKRSLLSDEALIAWLRSFAEREAFESYIKNFNSRLNIKHFMRSLYFRLLKDSTYEILTNVIAEELDERSNF